MLPLIQDLFIKTLWAYQFIPTLHLIMRRSSAEITNERADAVNIFANLLFFVAGSLLPVDAICLFHNFCLSIGSFASITSVARRKRTIKKKTERKNRRNTSEYIRDIMKRQHYYPLISMADVNFSRGWVKPVIPAAPPAVPNKPVANRNAITEIVVLRDWFVAYSCDLHPWRMYAYV